MVAHVSLHVQTCLRGLGFKAKKKDVVAALHQHGKQQADTIEYDVFESIMTERYLGRSFSELLDKAFEVFDVDGKGKISHRSASCIALTTPAVADMRKLAIKMTG
jgi:centrin-3